MEAVQDSAAADLAQGLTADRRTERVTIVFTDIVGSVQLKQRLGDDQGVRLIERHDALVRETLVRFPGAYETGLAGDSFMLVFARPDDAVQFSLVVQAGLRRLAIENGENVFDRIGIHVGEVFMEKIGGRMRPVRSIQIDTCARIMALGGADQILLSRTAFDGARAALHSEGLDGLAALSWLNHGHYALKGVDNPIEICEVGENGCARLSAPANSEKAHRVNTAEGEPVLGWRPAIGQHVPGTGWVLERPLGEGGFGEVWLGFHSVLKQRRVFKFCFRADRVRSLKREVTLFRLVRERFGEHPNIVTVHDVYFDEPPFYLIMDYVEGSDLAGWSKKLSSTPIETRLEIVAQAADGLQTAHEAGIIHRDVKPANILVGQDRGHLQVKLSDFGIGQIISSNGIEGVTQLGFSQTMMTSGSASGTHMYLPPEIVAGELATTGSDIYSLGIVLWQVIIGDFSRPLVPEWEKEISDPLLVEDLRKCFATDAATRFSAGQLAASLRALGDRHSGLAEERMRRAAAERRAYLRGVARTAGIACLVVLLVTGLAVFGFRQASAASAARAHAELLLSKAQLQRGEESLAANDAAAGLAYLAAIVRRDPRNTVAAERLLSALRDRNYAVPLMGALSHGSPLYDCAFSPDGARLVTVSENVTNIWDATTGARLLGPLPFGGDRIAFSPDGGNFAEIHRDARVFDARTGAVLFVLGFVPDGPYGKARSDVRFSPVGGRIATICGQANAQLWDATNGRRIGPPLAHPGEVCCLAFSPDGARLATGCDNGRIYFWATNSGAQIRQIEGDSRVEHLAFSRDGRCLVSGAADGSVRRWNAQTGDAMGEASHQGLGITDVAFSPDSSVILSTSHDGTMKLWNTDTGSFRGELPTDHFRAWAGRFSSDGRRIFTRSGNGSVAVWDADRRVRIAQPVRPGGFAETAEFSPDGSRLAVAGSDGTAIILEIDRTNATPLRVMHHAKIRAADVRADGAQIATGGEDGRVRFWDAWTADEVGRAILLPHGIRSVKYAADGTRVVTVSNANAVQLWTCATAEPVGPPIVAEGRVIAADISEDGHSVLIASEGGGVRMWDGANGQPMTPDFSRSVGRAAIVPHEGRAVVARGNFVGVWDTRTGEALGDAEAHTASIMTLAVSASGRYFATATYDRSTRAWRTDKGGPFGKELRNANMISGLEFSRDDHLLAATSFERTVELWDLAKSVRVGEALVHPDFVNASAFSPVTSRRLVTSSRDGVRLWDTATLALIEEPLRIGKSVRGAIFFPDGRRALVLPEDGEAAVIWEIPDVDASCPEWVADWAEAVGGSAVDDTGALRATAPDLMSKTRARIASLKGNDVYAATARWFFSARNSRTISPFSPVSAESQDGSLYPARPASAGNDQIDLTKYYNCRLDEPMISSDLGNSLEELEPGVRELAGTRFDVRGVVQVGNRDSLSHYPREIRGIVVGRKCGSLHFLHAAEFSASPTGTEIARYVVHYADGSATEIPVRSRVELDDWFSKEASDPLVVAWRGTNRFAQAQDTALSLFKLTWKNPLPDVAVATVDLVSSGTVAAPFVIAITAE